MASRCSKFRFRPLDIESTTARLQLIAQNEGLQLTPEIIPALIRASDGDMRRSITYLQSVARLTSARDGSVRADLTPATVAELAGIVPSRVIESLAHSLGIEPVEMKDEDEDVPAGGSSFDRIAAAVHHIERMGYSAMQVVLQVCYITYTAS